MTNAIDFYVAKTSKMQSMLIAVIAIAICTIHLGLDEFVSTQFGMFILITIGLIGEAVHRVASVFLLAIIIGVVVAMAAIGGDHQFQLIGKGIRTGVIMVLLFLIQSKMSRPSAINWGFIAYRAVYIACVASAILASVQLVDSLTRNSGIADLPVAWFALEYNTIFTDLRQPLAAVGFFVRPTAFFSEPSALAALSVLGLLIAYHVGDFKLKLISVYISFVSFSLLGLLFSSFYIMYQELTKQKTISGQIKLLITVSMFIMLGLVIDGMTNDVIMRRLNNVFSGDDISSEIRFIAPFTLIAHIFSEQNYFGVDNIVAYSLIPEHLTTVFSNWILNQFIFYGVLGVFFVLFPFFILRKNIWILMFMYMNANGDAFYYDRFFYLCLAIMVCCGAYSKQINQPNRMNL